MSRRGIKEKRSILPDPVFGDVYVAKFINRMMVDGKKTKAENIFYSVLETIKDKTGKDGLELFKEAINNVRPILEVRPRRVGGATYQVPMEVREERGIALSIRWLIKYARQRREFTMVEKLANELIDASTQKGLAHKKKEDTHRMAEANRAFAHFRW
ncbi:MAG: 30S ribosomal protein S7 [Deferribacterota bacterium]|nr:30S ribosomal protein S7 [Deferribacterota bacterium]